MLSGFSTANLLLSLSFHRVFLYCAHWAKSLWMPIPRGRGIMFPFLEIRVFPYSIYSSSEIHLFFLIYFCIWSLTYINIRSHVYLFCTLRYNPILFHFFCFSTFSNFGHWEHFQLALYTCDIPLSIYSWEFLLLSTPPTFWHYKMLPIYLTFFFLKPRNSQNQPFPKDTLFSLEDELETNI